MRWLNRTQLGISLVSAIIRISKHGLDAGYLNQQFSVVCTSLRGRHERHRRPLLQRRQANPREIAINERVQLDKSRSGFCWIALHEPTADELHTLQATYHLHPLAIDNAIHPLCPPKLEAYNDELYVVAQTAELIGDQICYGKTAIFTGHNHLISVRHGNAGALGNLGCSSRLHRHF